MKVLTPIKAIRAKCVDCCAGSVVEVRLCTAEKCPLYPYRHGHRPKEGNLSSNTESGENTAESTTFFENNEV